MKKFKEKSYVAKELSIPISQLDKIELKMQKRHPYQNWIIVRHALNGQSTIYYDRQFVNWIKEVFFGKGFYLDLEITFFEKLILEIAEEKNILYNSIKYNDMSLREMSRYFEKDINSIRVAIHRMGREYKSNLKYYDKDTLMIKAEGVKWISENYYRKSYLKYLENLKLSMEGNKID